MKKILTTLLFVFFLSTSVAFSLPSQLNGEGNSSEAQKKIAASINKIEIIEGIPQRKFIKLHPVWATASSMDIAMKKLKKLAVKQGANAIIQFELATSESSASSGAWGFYGASSQPQPVVRGWSVKWVQ